jgi:hypothetical protein
MLDALTAAGVPQDPRHRTARSSGAPAPGTGTTFADYLRRKTAQAVRSSDLDIDDDGEISRAEQLVRSLRELAEHLVIQSLVSPQHVDPSRATEAAMSLHRLANQLTKRIVEGKSVTDDDIVAITAEMADIVAWTMHGIETDERRIADDERLDGRIDFSEP